MRSIIVGIIIGIVVGIMAGTTMVAPNLEEAREKSALAGAAGTEQLDLDGKTTETTQSNTEPLSIAASVYSKRLRVVSLTPPQTPVLGDLMLRIQQNLPRSTTGQIGISLLDPNVVGPTHEIFKAVQSGAIDAIFSTPAELDNTSLVLKLFTSIPFGPESQEYLAWFFHGGGRELLNEHMNKSGVHVLLCGLLPQEASGWYRKPMRTIEDFRDLKIRIQGLGADVLARLGAQVVSADLGTILLRFEQGTLDAAEYSIPSIDEPLGLQKFARNYYVPGWHQPLTSYVLAFNKETWKALSESQQSTLQTICGDNVRYSLSAADAAQFEALKKLSINGVQVRRWPEGFHPKFEAAWQDSIRDHIKNNRQFAKTWSSLQLFRRDYAIWQELSKPQ
ncbi:MAG: TRAP transporter substrate-binding protein DctP [Magnetovibrio sp.]|nr:TRAP transporter substrate-binding protein DctP [Magnetovibrio sp.]